VFFSETLNNVRIDNHFSTTNATFTRPDEYTFNLRSGNRVIRTETVKVVVSEARFVSCTAVLMVFWEPCNYFCKFLDCFKIAWSSYFFSLRSLKACDHLTISTLVCCVDALYCKCKLYFFEMKIRVLTFVRMSTHYF